jgi:hypothetical protein
MPRGKTQKVLDLLDAIMEIAQGVIRTPVVEVCELPKPRTVSFRPEQWVKAIDWRLALHESGCLRLMDGLVCVP